MHYIMSVDDYSFVPTITSLFSNVVLQTGFVELLGISFCISFLTGNYVGENLNCFLLILLLVVGLNFCRSGFFFRFISLGRSGEPDH